MSSTTDVPPGDAPSRAPTARPRIPIPTFARGRLAAPRTTSTADEATTITTTMPPLPPREPGTHPGPGREPPPAMPTASPDLTPIPDDGDDGGGFLGFGTRRREPHARRTRTSTTTDGPSVEDLATALSGALAVLAAVAAWLIARSSRRRWDLREPDDDELAKIADPLARIADRHFGALALTPDIADGIAATAGVTAYVRTDPLYRTHDADTPADADPLEADLAAHGYQEP